MRAFNPDIRKLRWGWFVFSIASVAAGWLLLHEPWNARSVGLAVTWMLASWVGPLIEWAVADRKVPEVRRGSSTVAPIHWTRSPRGPFVLGLAESTLFYASFVAGAPELAGAWLIFKTAAKWASWQHIMLMPQELSDVDDIEYLDYRHSFSTKMVTVFVLGTMFNILAGATGYVVLSALSCAS